MAENNSSAPLNAFEKWYSDYHNDACDNHGGIDCTNPKGIAEDAWEACAALLAPQAVEAQAAPAAVAVSDEREMVIQNVMKLVANWGITGHSADFEVMFKAWVAIETALRAALAATPALPATEDSSAGDLAAVQAEPVADCYSDDDGDTWRDLPSDIDFVQGRKLGEEFGLQASVRSWPEIFRITKVPDENDDDYEVEAVSIRTAPQAQPADALTDPMPKVGPVGLSMLIAEVRKLPTTSATENDGEESDGTPKVWRNRPFVSLTQLELLLHEFLTLPAPEAQLTDGFTQAARNALADPTTKDGAS
ncbi:hypothetical protein [Comamonas sp.]|uniref:hypothetical protein n=1 Tax=Comamonas sp. TaxID=34028 RepID=UPI0028AB2842|nr:hypothetical protein [Comamonas sp.]